MGGVKSPRGAGEAEKILTHEKWSAKERVDIMVEFLSTNIGVAEICRKHGVSPTTFDNWRKRFMDADKRELGGNGRSDPTKALALENESLKIVVGEQALALAALKKKLGVEARMSAVRI